MGKLINWKVFWVLLGTSVLGIVCTLPYTLTVQAGLLEELPIPLDLLLTLQIVQNIVLFAFFILAGLYLAGKVGFRTPVLERWSRGEEVESALKSILWVSIILAVLAAFLIVALDFSFYFIFPTEPIYSVELPEIPVWQGFLVSFYGGINEEIMNRLFLMSLIVWMLSKIRKTVEAEPQGLIVWLAILAAAVIFGLLHLPSTAVLVPLTPFVITRSIILNGIAGTIFGWLYWRKGLESAMISHFVADIIIHGILPLLV
jgi:membrane protease YdiL (CAAX protease family)